MKKYKILFRINLENGKQFSISTENVEAKDIIEAINKFLSNENCPIKKLDDILKVELTY